jgi:hypothetical protein
MARDLTPSESEALARCGGLLKFAVETKEVPKSVVSTICAAWEAEKANNWDQQIATDFWLAFNSLCALIKPVTMDTLSTNLREIPVPKWKFWRKAGQAVSLSGRTAAHWVFLLYILLAVAVFLGYLVSTGSRLSTEIEKLITSGNELTEKIVAEADALEPVIGDKDFSTAGTDAQKAIALLQNQVQEQNYLEDQILQKTQLMSRLMSFGFSSFGYTPGTLEPLANIREVRGAVTNYYKIRQDKAQYQLKASIKAEVISLSILPIILGMMGACAYVVRLISDQIKDTTFSSTSPIRHRARVALGGLAGVVIGFGGVVNAGSLSASALAFVAGYAVEPVFATFDGIAEKFRRDKPSASV